MEGLTGRQAEVLAVVRGHYDATGAAPSVRGVGEAMGLRSSSTVYYHLLALERKGYLTRRGQRGFIPTRKGEGQGG